MGRFRNKKKSKALENWRKLSSVLMIPKDLRERVHSFQRLVDDIDKYSTSDMDRSNYDEARQKTKKCTSSEWMFLLPSLALEIVSAAFDEVSSRSAPHYALFGMLLAIAAALCFFWELIDKGIKERVVLRRWGMFWRFYHPPPCNTPFGTFSDLYGIVGVISQCICWTLQYVYFPRYTHDLIDLLSLLPLLCLMCFVCSKEIVHRSYTITKAISVEWIFLITSIGLEISSATTRYAYCYENEYEYSSPRKPDYALCGMLLAIAAVLVSIARVKTKRRNPR